MIKLTAAQRKRIENLGCHTHSAGSWQKVEAIIEQYAKLWPVDTEYQHKLTALATEIAAHAAIVQSAFNCGYITSEKALNYHINELELHLATSLAASFIEIGGKS